ncbi:MAG TPA: hypothetical protein VNB90_05885 [Cytophagaceae bacterium]|nr:hypothetical protein [Cytophagaceae bacterium]
MLFPDQVSGFSRVEYLSVFIALLYAFAVAEFFFGWTRMLRNRDGLTFSVDHLVFTGIYFWILLLNWYTLWMRIEYISKGFVFFTISIIPIMVNFLTAVFIFPDFDKVKDLNEYFDKNFNTIMILFAVYITMNVLIELYIGVYIWETILHRVINALLMLTVAVFNLKKLRRPLMAFLIFGIVMGTVKLAFI